MGEVFLKQIPSYDVDAIKDAILKGFSSLGIDIKNEVRGKRVLLKPNLLGAYPPEKAVTTHPSLVEAILKILKGCDCEIWMGDSPNGVQNSLEEIWEKTGMDDLARRYGVLRKFFEREGAEWVGELLISKPVLEADYIINLPKLKTHSLMTMTSAVKNMFGTVPGLKKASYHKISKTPKDFATWLVKIAESRRPDLNIVDGITAMAGNGPSAGYPVNLGLLAIGRDMYDIDYLLASILNIKPEETETLKAAKILGFTDLKPPVVKGDDASLFDTSTFKLPVTYSLKVSRTRFFNYLVNAFIGRLSISPKVNKRRCKRCGACIKICPASAIKKTKDGYPEITRKMCIQCYCCHEACPHRAIDLRESLILRLNKRISSKLRVK
jgi:uncharacterized protein (DUF362 family)/ferredoxin